ncbi:MAG: Swt1 family HEPN domain-containing protein [Phenylobacterium sp.]|uniref:Swt1 family HEPN domain-containing protein n=1 Tax=Phenylobacterium sp. TaxID=1871053 RepID=UPI0027365182|nr:Swt1 family HEPN domain-containing protein [Phenylobacterium sp.]MDP3746498.1 Swt1 family HEPN domain-containing protein [Phenylobacterium sp.]
MSSEYERLLGITMAAQRRADELDRATRGLDLFELARRSMLGPDLTTSAMEQALTREVQKALANHRNPHGALDGPEGATAAMLRQITAAQSAYEMAVLSHGLPSDTAALRRAAGQDLWEQALGIAQKQDLLRTAETASGLAGTAVARAAGLEDHLFHTPRRDELRSLLDQTLAAQRVTSANLGEDLLSAKVRGTFEALQTPWLHNQHALASARSMADLQMLGLAARDAPFAATAVETLRSHLGDWRDPLTIDPLWVEAPRRLELYAQLGLDRGLADFPAPAFERGLGLAGFPGASVDDADEADEGAADGLGPDHDRAREAFPVLQHFEVAVRRFIATAMKAAYGPGWAQTHVPANMREAWEQKRSVAERDGAPPRPLSDYADFTDHKAIIERGENWRTVFKPVFGRAEDVRESFQRLFPVRIATMHAHGLTQEDVLLLRVETGRILRAIRRAG